MHQPTPLKKIATLALLTAALWLFIQPIASAREATITILTTTDLHGNVLPTYDYEGNTDLGGLARCATKIAEIRKENPHTLLVDAGDTIQGTAVSFMSDGRMMMRLFNYLKYDAWTLGNHEFDWGLEKITRCIEDAQVPVLGANILVPPQSTNDPSVAAFKKVQPFVIKEVNGVKVALIGLTTPGVPNWSRPRLIQPLVFEQSVETLKRIMPQVRKAGAEVIVLVTHQGWREGPDDHANQIRAIVRSFPEIDVVLGGHTHRNFSELLIPSKFQTLYCQADHWGIYLGRVDLVYDTEQKKIIKKNSQTFHMDKTIALDPEIVKLSQKELDAADKDFKTVIGKAAKTFGTAGSPKRETPIHNLLCEAIDEALKKRGVQTDIIFHGVLEERGVLREGALTVADAWNVVPYENTIGVFEVTPTQLEEILNENGGHYERGSFRGVWGIQVTYKKTDDGKGAAVVSIADRDGKPLPADKKIKIAVNSFDIASGGTRFPKLREIADRPESKLVEYDFQTRQALIDYIKARESIAPRTVGWWTLKRASSKPSEPDKTTPGGAVDTP